MSESYQVELRESRPRPEAKDWIEVDVARITRPERWIGSEGNAFALASLIESKNGLIPSYFWYTRKANGQRDRLPVEPRLRVDGTEYFVDPMPPETATDAPAWSRTSRLAWLRGQSAPDPRELFEAVFRGFADYLEFERDAEGTVASLTCYVFTTYVYHALSAVGYLNLSGPAGSGKSRLLELLNQLVFRPMASSNLTAPALFRALHANGGSLLLDEGERLADKTPDAAELRSILLAGYKRGGTATRLEAVGKGFRVVNFDCYGPKVIAAIAPLPPALRSRCVSIAMFRAPAGSPKVSRRIEDDRERFANLRDELHVGALEWTANWLDEIKQTSMSASGRDRELWQPLLGLARWFDSQGCDGLAALVEGHALATIAAGADEAAPDADQLLLATLAAAVRCGELVTPAELLARVREREPRSFDCWTSRGVGSRLKSYGLVATKSNGRRCYRVSMDELDRVASRYGLDLEGDE